ncbi:hypothetical protein C1N91_01755 [Curtobacterium sp. SGAir0471]|uniref:hypothetical protein n=1 Tax=Curtobacterium sp. SGAir0471 TaxID=2070337 RepID=UPI0010CCC4D5|nr:hypothetical protein [Curtobacterium sp. SGAir0471]QCR42460.1 hypothetical protein C1N91_01755 [Curtobacterium sp. SGAir0471]
MADAQAGPQLETFLLGTVGKTVSAVQVLAPNALKSVVPLSVLASATIETFDLGAGRTFTLHAGEYLLKVDLQRTGRVMSLPSAQAWSHASPGGRPTARLQFTDGSAIDLSEPGRTKRITLELTVR